MKRTSILYVAASFFLGQFMPKGSASPAIGSVGQLELVEEDRVELVLNDKGKHEQIEHAILELKNVRVEYSLPCVQREIENTFSSQFLF